MRARRNPLFLRVASDADVPRTDGGLVTTTMRELAAIDRLDTPLGQCALLLARQLESRDAGLGVAAVAKEFNAEFTRLMDSARDRTSSVQRYRDELARRRAEVMPGA